jgi:hypothetical protein
VHRAWQVTLGAASADGLCHQSSGRVCHLVALCCYACCRHLHVVFTPASSIDLNRVFLEGVFWIGAATALGGIHFTLALACCVLLEFV